MQASSCRHPRLGLSELTVWGMGCLDRAVLPAELRQLQARCAGWMLLLWGAEVPCEAAALHLNMGVLRWSPVLACGHQRRRQGCNVASVSRQMAVAMAMSTPGLQSSAVRPSVQADLRGCRGDRRSRGCQR